MLTQHKGDNSSQSKNSRQWPYNPLPLLRTHEGMIEDARKSLEMKSDVSYKHFLVSHVTVCASQVNERLFCTVIT